MLSSLIIIAVIVIAVIMIFKSQDLVYLFNIVKKYAFSIIFIVLIIMFIISVNQVHNKYALDFTSAKGITQAFKIYFVWLKSAIVNVGKVSGFVVNQDWTLKNMTLPK